MFWSTYGHLSAIGALSNGKIIILKLKMSIMSGSGMTYIIDYK